MKKTLSLRALMCGLTMMATCLTGGLNASADYSKASTRFTYGGVSVVVIDRSKDVGKPYDTYGYAEYTNRTKYSITVKWKAYGILKSGGKLSKVDGGEFKLRPGETRKEVYSYSNQNHSYRDFEKFVVAIDPQNNQVSNNATSSFTKNGVKVQVVDRHKQQGAGVNSYGYLVFENGNDYKVKVQWTVYGVLGNGKRVKADSGTVIVSPKKTHKEVYQYDGNDDFDRYVAEANITKVEEAAPKADAGSDDSYSRIMSHKQKGCLTSQDYSDALHWLTVKFDTDLGPLYRKMLEYEKSQNEAGIDRLMNQNKALFDRYAKMGDLIEEADRKGKLNAEQKRMFQKLKDKVDAIM